MKKKIRKDIQTGVWHSQTPIVTVAKQYMMDYQHLLDREAAIQKAIESLYERATQSTGRVKAVNVQTSKKTDALADLVLVKAEQETMLLETKRAIEKSLAKRLYLIEQLSEEMYKTICTWRYINGYTWKKIVKIAPYEESQLYVFHRSALTEIYALLKHRSAS